MKRSWAIVVADRNPRVRQFLERELAAEGYSVQGVWNDEELWRVLNSDRSPDLVILDPDIPKLDPWRLISDLRTHCPSLPIVIHSFDNEYTAHPSLGQPSAYIEKSGSNINELKEVVSDLLRSRYPHRFSEPPSTEVRTSAKSGRPVRTKNRKAGQKGSP
ncbi:MAG: response regulator [Deltaproteobacteria bacterium]|nr:response regulator [Deltaproteobacteria bacterium]